MVRIINRDSKLLQVIGSDNAIDMQSPQDFSIGYGNRRFADTDRPDLHDFDDADRHRD